LNPCYVLGSYAKLSAGAGATCLAETSSPTAQSTSPPVPGCAVWLAAEVNLVGGGLDGHVGTSSVYGGWVQNVTSDAEGAIYQNGHLGTFTIASNVPGNELFLPALAGPPARPADPAPIPINPPFPLLDSVGYGFSAPLPVIGTGGNSSLMSTSVYQGDAIPNEAQPALGVRKVISAYDATKTTYVAVHPIDNLSMLTQVTYTENFSSNLILWSNSAGASQFSSASPSILTGYTTPPLPSGVPMFADHTYGLILTQPWSLTSTFSVNLTGNGTLILPVGPGVQDVALGAPSCTPSQVPCQVLPAVSVLLTPPTIQHTSGFNYQK
jgi:hypothetical protein